MIYKNIQVHISPKHYNNTVELSILGENNLGVQVIISTKTIDSSVVLDNSSFTYLVDDVLIGKHEGGEA